MEQNQIPANNSLQILPDGILELTQKGFQTKESIVQFQAKIDDLTANMHAENKKVLILVDVSGVTGQEPEVLAMARERLKGKFDALALVGTTSTVQMIINWLLHAIGDDARIRSFNDRTEATKWLLSH